MEEGRGGVMVMMIICGFMVITERERERDLKSYRCCYLTGVGFCTIGRTCMSSTIDLSIDYVFHVLFTVYPPCLALPCLCIGPSQRATSKFIVKCMQMCVF